MMLSMDPHVGHFLPVPLHELVRDHRSSAGRGRGRGDPGGLRPARNYLYIAGRCRWIRLRLRRAVHFHEGTLVPAANLNQQIAFRSLGSNRRPHAVRVGMKGQLRGFKKLAVMSHDLFRRRGSSITGLDQRVARMNGRRGAGVALEPCRNRESSLGEAKRRRKQRESRRNERFPYCLWDPYHHSGSPEYRNQPRFPVSRLAAFCCCFTLSA